MTGMMDYMIDKNPVIGDWVRLNKFFDKQEAEIIRVGKNDNVTVKFTVDDEEREWLAHVGEYILIADVPVPEIVIPEGYVYPAEHAYSLIGFSAIADRIEHKVYSNKLPYMSMDDKKYMTTDSIRAWRDAHSREESMIYRLFESDIMAAYNAINEDNKAFWSKVYNKAWEDHHSEGLLQIAQGFDEMMDMFFGFKVVKEV